LGLENDWKIDKVLLNEQIQRIDPYISHSGGALVCSETGETGRSMISGRSGFGAT